MVQLGRHLLRIHVLPRITADTPQLEDGGPDVLTLNGMRGTFKSFENGHIHTTVDDWTVATPDDDPHLWTGTTMCLTAGSPVGQDVSSERVQAQIADMASPRPWDGDGRPTSIYVDAAYFV